MDAKMGFQWKSVVLCGWLALCGLALPGLGWAAPKAGGTVSQAGGTVSQAGGTVSQAGVNAQARVVHHLERELIKRRNGFWGTAYFRSGRKYFLHFFGGNVDDLFEGSPDALREAHIYQRLQISGATIYCLGMAGIFASVLVGVYDPSFLLVPGGFGQPSSLAPQGMLALTGGVTVALVGILLSMIGQNHLNNAVRLYNRDVFERTRRKGWSFSISPTKGGAMALAQATF